jgi:iron-sulfur cluster assembly accessory protein
VERERSITLTPSAVARVQSWIREEKAQGKAFRIYVEPGSSVGYEVVYQLDRKHEDDRVFSSDGFVVVVDPWSFTYLAGALVDASLNGFSVRVPPTPWGSPSAETC